MEISSAHNIPVSLALEAITSQYKIIQNPNIK